MVERQYVSLTDGAPAEKFFATEYAEYSVKQMDRRNDGELAAYQRLRAAIFVDQLGWAVPVDARGREYDHYDIEDDPTVSVHGVFGYTGSTMSRQPDVGRAIEHIRRPHFLGGVRIFTLRSWSNSMVMREFADAGMLPDAILYQLQRQYDCSDLLELTRLCVQRGRRYVPAGPHALAPIPGFDMTLARDLLYTAVFSMAASTGRTLALALVHAPYVKIMRRTHFVFDMLYAHELTCKQGYALTMIDLEASMHKIYQLDRPRALRALSLCDDQCERPSWRQYRLELETQKSLSYNPAAEQPS